MKESVPLKRARRYFHSKPSYKTLMRWCDRGTFNRRTRKQCKLKFFYEAGRRFVLLEDIEQFKKDMGAVKREMPADDQT